MKHKTIGQATKLMQRATKMLKKEFAIIYYGAPIESWLVYESGNLALLLKKVHRRNDNSTLN
jgi:hypothetical protein